MSGQWEGFTEEDIRNISVEGSEDVHQIKETKLQVNPLRSLVKKNVRNIKKDNKSNTKNADTMKTPLDCMPIDTLVNGTENLSTKMIEVNNVVDDNQPLKNSKSDIKISLETTLPTNPSLSPNHVPVCIRIKEGRSYEVLGTQKPTLEEFQARQKLMEEQNRNRKELLGKALADRKKRTQAESVRLQQIQEELQKLDSLLSNDVSILRNQIEVASLEFSEAQKRYNKAEKEFLEAKLIMFGKLEQKELLTEHLCTIIEQNEMRKARKLSELMDKLELNIAADCKASEENKDMINTNGDTSITKPAQTEAKITDVLHETQGESIDL